MANKIAGDIFSSSGYDVVAHANVLEGGGAPRRGDVAILNNNSTHYLVVWRDSSHDVECELVRSFKYESDEDLQAAYAAALALMLTLALSN
jgi:hypothetical protein